MDLASPEYQEKVRSSIREADATMWAPDCSTLTRARERPIPGHRSAPRPLRSQHSVRGLPGLGARDNRRVELANSFLDFTLGEAEVLAKQGAAVVLEGLLRCYLWLSAQMHRLSEPRGWRRAEYNACAQTGARGKAQALEGNFEELDGIPAKCSHTHTPKTSGSLPSCQTAHGSTHRQEEQNTPQA